MEGNVLHSLCICVIVLNVLLLLNAEIATCYDGPVGDGPVDDYGPINEIDPYENLKWWMYPGTTSRTISLSCSQGGGYPNYLLPPPENDKDCHNSECGLPFNFEELINQLRMFCDAGVKIINT